MPTIDAGTLRLPPRGAKEFTGVDPESPPKPARLGPRPGGFREALDRERSRATPSSASPGAGPAPLTTTGAPRAAPEREAATTPDRPTADFAAEAEPAQELNKARADHAPDHADSAESTIPAPDGSSEDGAPEAAVEALGSGDEPAEPPTQTPDSRSGAEVSPRRRDAGVSLPLDPTSTIPTTPTITTTPTTPDSTSVPVRTQTIAGAPAEGGASDPASAPASGAATRAAAAPITVEQLPLESTAADQSGAEPIDTAEGDRAAASTPGAVRPRRDTPPSQPNPTSPDRSDRSVFVVVEEASGPPLFTPPPRSGASDSISAEPASTVAASSRVVPASVASDRSTGDGADRGNSRHSGDKAPPPSSSATDSSQPAGVQSPGVPSFGSQPAGPLGAAPADAAAPLPAPLTPEESQALAQSLSRGLTAALNQRGGVLTLRLAPESLGLIRIQMSLDQGAVSLRLETTNPAAQGLLSQNLAMLRATLESKGLSVEKLSIEYAPTHALASASSTPGHGHQGGAASNNSDSSADPGAGDSQSHDAAGDPSRGRRDHSSEDPSDHPAADGFGDDSDNILSTSPLLSRFGGRLRLRLETVA